MSERNAKSSYDKNRRLRYLEQMKKRRRKTYMVTSIAVTVIVLVSVALVFKYNSSRYVNYLKSAGISDEIKISKVKQEYNKLGLEPHITEIKYDWEGDFDYSNKPQYLVYHHTASVQISPEKINEMHSNKGWSGIGYHYYIRKDGTIYNGRPEDAVGAHAIGKNKDSIGICLEGNFEQEKLTKAQEDALVSLSIEMILKYNIKDSMGHKDVYSTLCPGKNFPMESIKKEIVDKLINISKSN